jgi:hypothetical protein
MKLMLRIYLTLIALLVAATQGLAEEDEGKIITVSPDLITIGKNHPSSYKINAATVIGFNGQPATIAALRPGMSATIVSQAEIAMSVAVIPSVAKEDDGKIVSVSRDSITIGKKHPSSYKVNAATVISVNGQRATIAALRPGMSAQVVAQAEIATSIAAKNDLLKGPSLDMKPKKNK